MNEARQREPAGLDREQSSELIAQQWRPARRCSREQFGTIWSDGGLPLEQRNDHQCGD